MPLPTIKPPLVNSANPWCTTIEHLQELFDSESTGAITTRTSLLDAFEHDSNIHQFAFFDSNHSSRLDDYESGKVPVSQDGSLNTLGYSPIPLATYLGMLERIVGNSKLPGDVRRTKPIIISVTGSSEDVVECYRQIRDTQKILSNPLCMEINLSCPNIPHKPPPAYSKSSLAEYLQALGQEANPGDSQRVAVGIKTPPYTYHDQFQILIDALKESSNPNMSSRFHNGDQHLGLEFDSRRSQWLADTELSVWGRNWWHGWHSTPSPGIGQCEDCPYNA
jgi:dihydroorotate dehydrogenase (fumarate)